MSDEQLMITTFTKAYNKYIYDEMVIGQLAHTELKDGVKTGAEVDVIMPAMVNLFDYNCCFTFYFINCCKINEKRF